MLLLLDYSFLPFTKPSIDAIRNQAVLKLWERAAGEVVVRYPDPMVKVILSITNEVTILDINEIKVSFLVQNVRDTAMGNPNRIPAFLHVGYTRGWPGPHVAKVFIASLWTIYLAHEAQELVTCKDATHDYQGSDAVINPHSTQSVSQHLLLDAQSSKRSINTLLAWSLGVEQANALIAAEAIPAEKQLQREIADWTPSA